MFFKKKIQCLTVSKKYSNALSAVKSHAVTISDTNDKVTYLKLIRESIIDEMACEYKNKILYHGAFRENEHRVDNPFFCWDKFDSPYHKELDESHTCDLSKNNIVSFPWNISRYVSAFNVISKYGFEYHNTNHMVNYFPQLNLYIAYNGLHSISAGVTSKNGKLPCSNSYDITKMFESIYSLDGRYWCDTNDAEFKEEISDFRFALIFEISKLIWKEGV